MADMTSTENTATPYAVKYRKSDARYYVTLDGTQVGWVLKSHDGGWAFYAATEDPIHAKRLALEPQRQQAVEEGLSMLRIYHGGRVMALDLTSGVKDVPVYFDTDRLAATTEAMNVARWGF